MMLEGEKIDTCLLQRKRLGVFLEILTSSLPRKSFHMPPLTRVKLHAKANDEYRTNKKTSSVDTCWNTRVSNGEYCKQNLKPT